MSLKPPANGHAKREGGSGGHHHRNLRVPRCDCRERIAIYVEVPWGKYAPLWRGRWWASLGCVVGLYKSGGFVGHARALVVDGHAQSTLDVLVADHHEEPSTRAREKTSLGVRSVIPRNKRSQLLALCCVLAEVWVGRVRKHGAPRRHCV